MKINLYVDKRYALQLYRSMSTTFSNTLTDASTEEYSELVFYYGEEPPAVTHFLDPNHYYTDAPIHVIRSVLQQFCERVHATVTKDDLYEMRFTVDESVEDETDETVFQVSLFSNTSPTHTERYVIEIMKLRGDSYVFINCVRSAQTMFTSSELISFLPTRSTVSWMNASEEGWPEPTPAEMEAMRSAIAIHP